MLFEQARTQQPRQPLRRKYWADAVSLQGKFVIEQLRIACSITYEDHKTDGYYAVDDIPPQTRGVYTMLAQSQRRIALQWAITQKIKKLEAEDIVEGRQRVYQAVDGAARPRKGRRWKDIADAEHVSWQPTAVTIMAKDTKDEGLFAHAAAEAMNIAYSYQ